MKRSPLKRKTPLLRKTPLRAKSGFKTAQKRATKATKPKLETLPSLVKKADKAFSRYVRLRDSEYVEGEWLCQCITCGRRVTVIDREGRWGLGIDAGHFVSRGRKVIRWSELNVNGQCRHCNIWRDKESMLAAYKKALNMKYGDRTWQSLKREGNIEHKPTREELHQVINDSKEATAYMLSNTDKYTTIY